MLVYDEDGANNVAPHYRTWSGSDLSVESNAQDDESASDDTNHTIVAASTTRNEYIMGRLEVNGHLDIQVFNGSTWSDGTNAPTNGNFTTGIGTTNDVYRGFDIAYEEDSGDAIVVYESTSTGDGLLKYRTWDGNSWSNEASIDYSGVDEGNDVARWVECEADHGSDYIMCGWRERTNLGVYAAVWTGSAWQHITQISAQNGTSTRQDFDVAWEGTSGEGMIVYGDVTGAPFVDASTYTASGGFADTSGMKDPGAAVQWLTIASSPSNNYIAVMINDTSSTTSADMGVEMWNGSDWSTVSNPTDDSDINNNGYAQGMDVAWEQGGGDRALFVWRDGSVSETALRYMFYDISANQWQAIEDGTQCANTEGGAGSVEVVTALANAEDAAGPCTATLALADSFSGVSLRPDPASNKIMVLAQDLTLDLVPEAFLYNGDANATWTQTATMSSFEADLSTGATLSTSLPTRPYDFAYRESSSTNVSTFGSQTTSVDGGTTNFHVGGGFAINRTALSTNVTSITIAEQGTVDGQANLDNIKLYYDSDTTAPYNCASESYSGGESQFGSTDTDGFSAANGSSTFTGSVSISSTSTMCVYVVLDITSGATDGQTIEIQITNPNTDVAVSAGTVGPDHIRAISGTTTISVFSISGTCAKSDRSTACDGDDGSDSIKVAYNGVVQGQSDTTVDGSWQITGLANPATGDVVTIYIDGAADSREAVAVTKYDGAGAMSGVLLYWQHLTIGSSDNQSVTNANLSTGWVNDEDVFYSVSTNNLTVDATTNNSGQSLYVLASNTYAPGGTITLAGSWINAGTFTHGSSTVTLNGTTSGYIINANNSSGPFNNLTLNGSGGVWTVSTTDLAVANILTITAGNLSGGSRTTTLSATGTPFVNNGTFTYATSTIRYTGNGATNITAANMSNATGGTNGYYNLEVYPAGATAHTLGTAASQTIGVANNLTIGDGANAGATGTTNNPAVTVGGVLTIATAATLTTGSGTYTLTGSGTPFVVNGTGVFTASTGNTVAYTGTGTTNVYGGVDDVTNTYYNLSLLPAATVTYRAGSAGPQTQYVSASNNLTIGNGTNALTLDIGNFNPVGFAASGTMTLAANAVLSGSGDTFIDGLNVVINGTVNTTGTARLRADGANSTFQLNTSGNSVARLRFGDTVGTETSTASGGGSITVTNEFSVATGHTLNAGNLTYTLTGTSGTPFVKDGTFQADTSTVVYAGNNGAGNTTITNTTYNNLTLNASETFTMGTNQTVNGTLTITTGTLTAPSGTLTIGDDFFNSGTFTHNSGTILFTGAVVHDIGGSSSTAFNNFTNTTAGSTLRFKHHTTNVPLYDVAGTFTVTGANGNNITITSDDGANQWLVDFASAQSSVTYATISYSGCLTSATVTLDATSNNGGNNGTCWSFPAAGITVAGVVYLNDETTADGTGYTIKASINGGTAASGSSNGSGVFSFTTSGSPNVGEFITLWLDTAGGNRGTLVLKYGASCTGYTNCTGLKIVRDQVRLENFNTGSIINTDLAACDNDTGTGCADTDIGFTANAGVLTVASNWELKVATGVTFAPGNTVTTPKLDVAGTYTGASETLTLNGSGSNTTCTDSAAMPLCVGGTFTAPTTVDFTGSSAALIKSGTYVNLGVKPGANTITHTLNSGSFTISGNFTAGNGTNTTAIVDADANDPGVEVSGVMAVSNNTEYKAGGGQLILYGSGTPLTIGATAGVFTASNSDVKYLGTSATNIAAATYYSLFVGDSANSTNTTYTLGGNVSAFGLTIGASSGTGTHTLDASDKTLTITGTGAVFTVNSKGAFSGSTSTVIYAPSSPGTVTVGSVTYHHITFNGTGSTFNLSSGGITTDNGGDLTITAGTLDAVSGQNYPVSIGGNFVNNATYTYRSNTTTFTSTSTGRTLSGSTNPRFYNLTFNGSGGGWSAPGASPIVDNTLAISAGTLSGTNDWYVADGNVSGNGVINLTGGTFTLGNSNGTFGGNTAWTFNNLVIGDALTRSSSASGSGSVTVTGTFTITTNMTFDAGSKTYILSGTGTPFVKNGTLTPNASIFRYTGNGATNITSTAYYDLEVKPAGATAHTFGTGASQTLTANNITIGDGTNAGATADTNDVTLDVNGNFTIAAGATFTASNAVNMTVAGSWANSGTFSNSGRVVNFDGTGTGKTIVAGGNSNPFHDLTISGSGTWTVSTNALKVNRFLTVNSGTLQGDQDVTVLGGDVSGTGTINMTGGTFLTDGDTVSGWGSDTAWTFYNLTFGDGTGVATTTISSSSNTQITVTNVLTIAANQSLDDAPGKNWIFSGSGTPIVNTGQVSFDSVGVVTFTSGSGVAALATNAMTSFSAFPNLVINGAGTFTAGVAVAVKDSLTVSGGTLAMGANALTVGNVSNTNSGNVKVASGQSITQSSGATTTILSSASGANCIGSSGTACSGTAGTITFGNLTIGDASTSLTTTIGGTSPTITVGGLLTITTNATLGAGSSTLALTGNSTVFTNNGNFTPSTSTVAFISTATTGTTVPALTYYNLTLNKASNTFTGTNSTIVQNNFTITAGTFTAPSGDFTVGGNFTNAGAFTHNSGTVIFNSSNIIATVGGGDVTFYNVTVATPGKTLKFTSGNTFRFNGTLTLTGSAGIPVSLLSSSNGAQWTFYLAGSASISYINVQDSACHASSVSVASSDTINNGGNNGNCWGFIARGGGGSATADGGSGSSGNDNQSGGGAGATCGTASGTVTISDGAVTAVVVVNGGGCYTAVPVATICGGGGSGATITAVLTNGVVTSVTVNAGGSGYGSPTVVFGNSPDGLGGGCPQGGGGQGGGGGGGSP